MTSPMGFSLSPYIKNTPALARACQSAGKWYAGAMGYRRMGLKYDDLINEEHDDIQRALGRLTPRETYDRSFRFKRAFQASVLHKDLPKEQWIPEEQDVRYLTPHIEDVHKEEAERAKWDTIEVERK
ncbi:cytochrome bd ubiquinol oxidase subunit [Vararia minispora EC-137]|uniref:Cytochrome bd ubiquinol oxidase subunit n=1 Tax=Vararia minispora EC-137 TaxID=1314806 RepID=A0ACB8QCV6_9AGAM|nr:cytochrome bd ubiquinol oxidase subunit [Vararia minispora EC-137]